MIDIADRIVRFGEGLCGTRQFWIKRQFELADMIRQLGSQGIVFFTFSAADLYWPELYLCRMPRVHQLTRNQLHTGVRI